MWRKTVLALFYWNCSHLYRCFITLKIRFHANVTHTHRQPHTSTYTLNDREGRRVDSFRSLLTRFVKFLIEASNIHTTCRRQDPFYLRWCYLRRLHCELKRWIPATGSFLESPTRRRFQWSSRSSRFSNFHSRLSATASTFLKNSVKNKMSSIESHDAFDKWTFHNSRSTKPTLCWEWVL